MYFRKPIVVNNYSIYSHDIKPLGFRVVEMDDFVSAETVRRTHEVIDNPDLVQEMVEENYRLALQYFSYRNLEEKLKGIAGVSTAWRKRIAFTFRTVENRSEKPTGSDDPSR